MTEKNYNPEQKTKRTMKNIETSPRIKKEPVKTPKIEEKKIEQKTEEAVKEEGSKQVQASSASESGSERKEVKTEEKAKETKKKPEAPKVKKTEAVLYSFSVPISTKKSMALCDLIRGKKLDVALKEMEEVAKGKKVVPMRGEIPHRKGNIMSGRYPIDTAKSFVTLLKGLVGNANVNGLDEPVIVEAIANLASRPYGRFGAWQKKRTNIKLVAREKKLLENKKGKKGGK